MLLVYMNIKYFDACLDKIKKLKTYNNLVIKKSIK